MIITSIIVYIALGFLPCIFWLWYYLKKDLHPEPKKTILKVFFYGLLITLPVFGFEIWFTLLLAQAQKLPFFIDYPIFIELIRWFFIIALVEEFLKYLGLRFAVLNDGALDEPIDLMIYMVIVALGFAGIENILYVISYSSDTAFLALPVGVLPSFLRFISATLLHTLCSSLLGYYLALSFLNTKKRLELTITGITLATLLHGLYDFSIMTLEGPMRWVIPVVILTGLGIFTFIAYEKIKKVKSICNVSIT